MKIHVLLAVIILPAFIAVAGSKNNGLIKSIVTGHTLKDSLPAPYSSKSAKNFSKVIGWLDAGNG